MINKNLRKLGKYTAYFLLQISTPPSLSYMTSKKNILVLLSIFIISLLINYSFLTFKNKLLVTKNLNIINSLITENFDETERLLISIGKEIVEVYPKNSEILQIFLRAKTKLESNNIFSWSLFDWVNIKGFQIINTELGIRSNPPQIGLSRNYLNREYDEWKIIFSEVAIGNPSNVLIIPVGLKVKADKGRIGAIAMGIEIKKLTNLINKKLDPNINFLVVDNRSKKIAFGSYNLEALIGESFSTALPLIKNIAGITEQNMGPKYPYSIWVGYDLKKFWYEVFYYSVLLSFSIVAIILYKKKR